MQPQTIKSEIMGNLVPYTVKHKNWEDWMLRSPLMPKTDRSRPENIS